MSNIRPAKKKDADRIAEIVIFNYRTEFYPVFKNDSYYFDELRVCNVMKKYESELKNKGKHRKIYVYDDGVVKGFIHICGEEVKKLFVEPVLQGGAIGSQLLRFAIEEEKVRYLWALEKNERAIRFYQRHGFRLTENRKPEEDTDEYLVMLERS